MHYVFLISCVLGMLSLPAIKLYFDHNEKVIELETRLSICEGNK